MDSQNIYDEQGEPMS